MSAKDPITTLFKKHPVKPSTKLKLADQWSLFIRRAIAEDYPSEQAFELAQVHAKDENLKLSTLLTFKKWWSKENVSLKAEAIKGSETHVQKTSPHEQGDLGLIPTTPFSSDNPVSEVLRIQGEIAKLEVDGSSTEKIHREILGMLADKNTFPKFLELLLAYHRAYTLMEKLGTTEAK